jgi:hypothetical protein
MRKAVCIVLKVAVAVIDGALTVVVTAVDAEPGAAAETAATSVIVAADCDCDYGLGLGRDGCCLDALGGDGLLCCHSLSLLPLLCHRFRRFAGLPNERCNERWEGEGLSNGGKGSSPLSPLSNTASPPPPSPPPVFALKEKLLCTSGLTPFLDNILDRPCTCFRAVHPY